LYIENIKRNLITPDGKVRTVDTNFLLWQSA